MRSHSGSMAAQPSAAAAAAAWAGGRVGDWSRWMGAAMSLRQDGTATVMDSAVRDWVMKPRPVRAA